MIGIHDTHYYRKENNARDVIVFYILLSKKGCGQDIHK